MFKFLQFRGPSELIYTEISELYYYFVKILYMSKLSENTKIDHVQKGTCRQFYKFFGNFRVIFLYCDQGNYWENRKTRQIKYQLVTICYRKVTHVKTNETREKKNHIIVKPEHLYSYIISLPLFFNRHCDSTYFYT